MSWKDNLLSGSFRGIPFHVDSHEYSSGRRTSVFDLLGEEDFEPIIEDSGPESDEYSIEFYIIQQDGNNLDYFPVRDDMISALKREGSGLLIHPYLGEITVRVLGRFSMAETWKEGGIARFTVTFVRSVPADPERTSDFDSTIDDKVDDMNDIATDNYGDQYESGGVFQETTANAIVANMENLTVQMYSMQNIVNKYVSEAVGAVAAGIQLVDDLIDAPCDLATGLLNAGNQLLNLVGLGVETITGGIIGGCTGITRNAEIFDGSYVTQDMGKKAIKAIIKVLEYDSVENVYVPEEQTKNIILTNDTFAVYMIGIGCKILIKTEFDSQETLIEYMNLFVASIDDIMDRLGDEGGVNSDYIGGDPIGTSGVQVSSIDGYKTTDIYNAVQDVRNAFVNEMLAKNTTIAKTNDYVVGFGNKSTLQLAYELYGDIDRDEDIYDRNKPLVKHPGFLPGGEVLKVLSE